MAEMVKNPPAFQETGWGRGGEDTLENGMAIHSNMLPGEFNRQEPDGLQFMGSQRVRHNLVTQQQQHLYQHRGKIRKKRNKVLL